LIDALWTALCKTEQIPFKIGANVAFLYKGDAQQVHWYGDFNGWGGAKSVLSNGARVGKSPVWLLEIELPEDARLDYKIVVDGSWILDEMNPYACKSGFGHSSELRMPHYRFADETSLRADVSKGSLESLTLHSKHLGYDISIMVYLPCGYKRAEKLPVIYATDGHEYLDDEQGALRATLDNLIYDKKISPAVAVFIDPRNPHNHAENRRLKEYALNDAFGRFMVEELIPKIDARYKTNPSPHARLILGTSMGGLCAGYLGVSFPNIFGLIAIQSPAFWNKPEIFSLYRKAKHLKPMIYLSTGVIHDSLHKTREMRDLFVHNGYSLFYRETNESHSWGTWRGRMPEMLLYFFGSHKHQIIHEIVELQPTHHRLKVKHAIKLNFSPQEDIEHATLKLYDIFGREVSTVFQEKRPKGFYTFDCIELGLSRGLYFYHLKSKTVSKFKLISVR
jgi:enterochelin esterase family protein